MVKGPVIHKSDKSACLGGTLQLGKGISSVIIMGRGREDWLEELGVSQLLGKYGFCGPALYLFHWWCGPIARLHQPPSLGYKRPYFLGDG